MTSNVPSSETRYLAETLTNESPSVMRDYPTSAKSTMQYNCGEPARLVQPAVRLAQDSFEETPQIGLIAYD